MASTLLPPPGSEALFARPQHLFRPAAAHTRLDVVPETLAMIAALSAQHTRADVEVDVADIAGSNNHIDNDTAAKDSGERAGEGDSAVASAVTGGKISETPPPSVVVVCVVGSQRGGKSTLLNLLHSRQPGGRPGEAGFGLGHTMSAHTTGLWVWAKPHPRRDNCIMLLVDTEGLDSPHVPPAYNWMISALALLISTCFIYQTRGSIDSNATDRLGAILQVAQQLQRSAAVSRDSAGTSSSPQQASTLSTTSDIILASKPTFLWLVRDHQLLMTTTSGREEMEQKLDSASLQAMKRSFGVYDCFMLPRPVADDSQLLNVESMQYDDLVPAFREEYAILERHLLTSLASSPLILPTARGEPVSGLSLSALCMHYARALNNGPLTELSQLPTQRQIVLQMAGEKSVRTATNVYRATLIKAVSTTSTAVSAIDLLAAHSDAFRAAVDAFCDDMDVDMAGRALLCKCMDENNMQIPDIDRDTAQYFNKLCLSLAVFKSVPARGDTSGSLLVSRTLVSGVLFDVWKDNYARSFHESQQKLAVLWDPIRIRLSATLGLESNSQHSAFSSLKEFDDAVQQIITDQIEQSREQTGPAWNCVWDEFLSKTVNQQRLQVLQAVVQAEFANHLVSLDKQVASNTTLLREEFLEGLRRSEKSTHEAQRERFVALEQHVSSKLVEARDTAESARSEMTLALERTVRELEGKIDRVSAIQSDFVVSSGPRLDELEGAVKDATEEISAAASLFAVTKGEQEASIKNLNEGLVALKSITISALRESNVCIEQVDGRLSTLEKSIHDAEGASATEVKSLSLQLAELNARVAELEKFDGRPLESIIADLQKDLASASIKLEVFERAFSGMDAQFDSMAEDLKRRFLADAESLISARDSSTKAESDSARDAVQHLKETCDALWSSVAALSARSSDIESTLDSQSTVFRGTSRQ